MLETPMHVEPYLFFNGQAEQAIAFYREAIGAEVTLLMRYSDSPDPAFCPPGAEDKVMHANLQIGDTTVMLSDGDCSGNPVFSGISLSIGLDDPARAREMFDALADGGQVTMPLEKTFWSPAFGSLLDRFGVAWMIDVLEQKD